jgi:hypothetical protein
MDKLINDQYQKRIQFFENSTKAKEKLIQRFLNSCFCIHLFNLYFEKIILFLFEK